ELKATASTWSPPKVLQGPRSSSQPSCSQEATSLKWGSSKRQSATRSDSQSSGLIERGLRHPWHGGGGSAHAARTPLSKVHRDLRFLRSRPQLGSSNLFGTTLYPVRPSPAHRLGGVRDR